MFPTEFDFVLPKGLLSETGESLYRQGRMRLATAKDELSVHNHPRVKREPDYSHLVMLAQVITQLGPLTDVQPDHLEQLFSKDLAYLKEFFNRINQQDSATIPTTCPQCQHQFQVELTLSGES